MSTALVLSLLFHALLLSLTFDGEGFGLPGLGLPWRERRLEVGDMRVTLLPAAAATQVTATPPALTDPSTNLIPTGMAKPEPITAPDAMTAMTNPAVSGPENQASPPTPAPTLVAAERPDTATVVPAPQPVLQPVSTPVITALPDATSAAVVLPTPRDASDVAPKHTVPEMHKQANEQANVDPATLETQKQADHLELAREIAARQQADSLEAARQATIQLEAQRAEAVRQEAEHQEAARVEAARVEAERQQAARQAMARQEATQLEEQRLQAARQAAAQQEAQRAETARLEAQRQQAARVEAERQEAARADAKRQEAERVEAGRQEEARQEAAKQDGERQNAARAEQEAKREERLRAIGRQLNEEADKRKAAELAAGASSPHLEASSRARRGRLFGHTDPNSEFTLYAQAWSRKIELNRTFDMVREAAKQRHTHPLVTVALRSDGSVESVTIVVSSGVAEIDDAVRRIVQSQAPYPAFPPGLASEYDVIEIRRTWYFDTAVRLY